MIIEPKHKQFYLFDYFVDGKFVKIEEVIGEDLPCHGDVKIIDRDGDIEICGVVVDMEEISENEYRVLLDSLK